MPCLRGRSRNPIMLPSIRNAPRISHLLFVDDLAASSEGNIQSATYIKQSLQELSSFLGLEVNSTKSVIFFFQARESKNEISSIFDYHVESSPHRLFGSSFEFKKLLYAMYLPLIKLELSSWAPQVWHTEPSTQESSLLFDVGCLQLIKKILSAMSRLLHLSSSRGSSIMF